MKNLSQATHSQPPQVRNGVLKSNIVGFGHWRFEPVLIGKSWRRFADFDGKIIALHRPPDSP